MPLSEQQRRGAQGRLTSEHSRPTDLVENMTMAVLQPQRLLRGRQVPQLARMLQRVRSSNGEVVVR